MITVTLMKKQKNSEKKQHGWEYLKTWVGIF